MDLTYIKVTRDEREKGKNIWSGLQSGQGCSGRQQAMPLVTPTNT